MNYRIIIPTYKRANILWDNTLSFLKKYGYVIRLNHNYKNELIRINESIAY